MSRSPVKVLKPNAALAIVFNVLFFITFSLILRVEGNGYFIERESNLRKNFSRDVLKQAGRQLERRVEPGLLRGAD